MESCELVDVVMLVKVTGNGNEVLNASVFVVDAFTKGVLALFIFVSLYEDGLKITSRIRSNNYSLWPQSSYFVHRSEGKVPTLHMG